MNEGALRLKKAPGSQEAKARKLGVTQAYVSLVIGAKKRPNTEMRKQLLQAFGIEPKVWDVEVDAEGSPVPAVEEPPASDPPVSTEREPQRLVKVERAPVPDSLPSQASDPEPVPTEALVEALEVQRLLEEGRPPAEVYGVVQRVLTRFLVGGLSPDLHRAWSTLLKSLREAAQERGRVPPLHEHPAYLAETEAHLDDLEAVLRRRFGGEAAGQVLGELAELQRARENPTTGAKAA